MRRTVPSKSRSTDWLSPAGFSVAARAAVFGRGCARTLSSAAPSDSASVRQEPAETITVGAKSQAGAMAGSRGSSGTLAVLQVRMRSAPFTTESDRTAAGEGEILRSSFSGAESERRSRSAGTEAAKVEYKLKKVPLLTSVVTTLSTTEPGATPGRLATRTFPAG